MSKATRWSTSVVFLVWANFALGATTHTPAQYTSIQTAIDVAALALQESPTGTLIAEATDLNPITFTIVDNGGDAAVPDVIVTGAGSGNGAYLDISSIAGRAGPGDTIAVGIDAATTWNLSGPNTGTVTVQGYSSLAFSALDSLLGAAGPDTFVFPNSVAFGGTLDGGSGATNTLDYSARTTGVTVNLAMHTATGTNGISNIQNVTGGAGNDTITGDSSNDTLTGGPGKDTLTGGGGADTLVETRDADFTLTNTSLIIGSEGTDTLSGIEVARLTGGPGNNTLNATTFTGAVILDGAAGDDTLRGGSGNDTLTGGPGADAITGGPGVNTVVETRDADFVLTGTSLAIAGETDTLIQIQNARLIGGPGDNDFTVSGFTGGSVWLDGGADGTDTLTLAGGSILVAACAFTDAHAGSVNLDGSVITYTGLDLIDATLTATDIVLNYGNADETITLADAGPGRTAVASTAGATVTLDNPSGALTIDAGGGNDTVNLAGLGSGFAADLFLDGNTGYDALTLEPQAVPVGLITGGITIPGFPSVSYGTSIEAVNIADDAVVSADATLSAREYNLSRLVVTNNSVLTLGSDVSAPGFPGVRITASGDLTIDAGSLMSADGQGYAAGQGPGAGATVSSDGASYGGGAGYGEQGGDGAGGAQGGAAYGSSTEPTDLGSGGGYDGGAGGGAVRLVVNGTLLLDGGIVCCGAVGGYHSGGGAGGSIYLTTGTLAGAGTIAADGGAAGADGGGGAGGRIAIYGNTDTFAGTITALGGAGFNPGGTGTIYLPDAGVSPEDCLAEGLTALRGLTVADFTNARSGDALTNKLEATIALIEAGLYQDARMKLQHDLLPKMDGCAVTGKPDKGDWIVTCAAQQQVYPLVLQAIQLLEDLL